jgi:hypothetical protein
MFLNGNPWPAPSDRYEKKIPRRGDPCEQDGTCNSSGKGWRFHLNYRRAQEGLVTFISCVGQALSLSDCVKKFYHVI